MSYSEKENPKLCGIHEQKNQAQFAQSLEEKSGQERTGFASFFEEEHVKLCGIHRRKCPNRYRPKFCEFKA